MLYGSRVVVCFFAFFFSFSLLWACMPCSWNVYYFYYITNNHLKRQTRTLFFLSTHKVYLKHKKQTQIHVVSSEWWTCTFNNVEICKSSACYPSTVTQNLNGAVIILLSFGVEWKPIMSAYGETIDRYALCTWVICKKVSERIEYWWNLSFVWSSSQWRQLHDNWRKDKREILSPTFSFFLLSIFI